METATTRLTSRGQDPIVCVATIAAELTTIDQLRRLAAQLFQHVVLTDSPRYDVADLLRTAATADCCLCLIDVDLDRQRAFQVARSLRQQLGDRLLLVAVSASAGRSEVVVEMMRSGCSDCLSKPLDFDQLRYSVQGLSAAIWRFAPEARSGKVMAFVGARGGAGTTTTVVNLATFLVRHGGKRALIIDLHRQLGHVWLYLGLPRPQYHIYDLLRNIADLDVLELERFISHSKVGVDVIPAPDELFNLPPTTADAVQRAISSLSANYDFVLLDCPHGLGASTVAILQASDEIHLLATPDIPALHDMSKYLEGMKRLQLPQGKIRVIINRHRSQGELSLEDIEKTIAHPVSVAVPNSAQEVISAMNSGEPVPVDGKSIYAKYMRKWTDELANPDGESVATQRASTNPLSRFLTKRTGIGSDSRTGISGY